MDRRTFLQLSATPLFPWRTTQPHRAALPGLWFPTEEQIARMLHEPNAVDITQFKRTLTSTQKARR